MKRIKLWSGIFLLAAVTCFAEELSAADKKWCQAVETKIAQGDTTISTPSAARAKLARELATKHGRSCTVEQTDRGFRIIMEKAKTKQTAAK